MAVPTTLPTTPTTSATSIAAIPTITDETVLASRTLPRCGTRVNVVSPVRWLHSPVIDEDRDDRQHDRHREADRRGERVVGQVLIGGEEDRPDRGEDAHDDDAGHQPEPGAGVEHLAQLDADDASQGDRRTSRELLAGCGGTVGEVVVVMPLSFLVGCRR